MDLMNDLRMGPSAESGEVSSPTNAQHHTFQILGLIQERLSLGTRPCVHKERTLGNSTTRTRPRHRDSVERLMCEPHLSCPGAVRQATTLRDTEVTTTKDNGLSHV